MAIGSETKAPLYILGTDGQYHKLYNENIVDQIIGLGRRPSYEYSVGDVVLCAGSMSLQLICTVAGTTSTDELDITGKVAGDSIADGTVTWIVAKRNYFNNSGVLPISEGGTGASTASQACANLGALPTSGGVMIGQTAMVRNVANSSLRIGGGLSYEAGASLSLCGKSMTDYAGQFLLGAGDETAKKYLNGFPSGELYWDSKRVLTCDTSFNSTSKQSVLKFSDGTMIICGTATTNTSAYVNITYNVPFTAIPYSFTCTKMAEGALLNHYAGTSEETATGLQVKTNLTGINAVIEFMALGRWY